MAMVKTLTLFEHEAKPFDWQDRDLALLERMRRSTGADVLRATVRAGKRHIQASQYVGVIRSGDRNIQILPKLFQSSETASEEVKVKEATANLLRMLAYSGDLGVREHELAQLLRRKDNWFEILTRLFANHLREEWQRGAYRSYHLVEDELQLLKGKWRIGEQLKHPTRQHIFSVSYDEFGADIPLNRIFRFVVERLWHLTRDNENRKLLGELRQWMEEVTLLPRVSISDANPAALTRLSERYRPLLNLARMFLDGSTLQLSAGKLSTFASYF